MAENKVKFGLEKVHYAPHTHTEGVLGFSKPIPIPGAVSLSLEAQGDSLEFYADNVAYYVSTSNDGYDGNLEVARVPDDFRKNILMEQEDVKDKVLIENALAETESFALLFEFTGDKSCTRHVLYNCTTARPGVSGKTKTKGKEVSTESLKIKALPLAGGNVKAKTAVGTSQTIYDDWFGAVWVPQPVTPAKVASDVAEESAP